MRVLIYTGMFQDHPLLQNIQGHTSCIGNGSLIQVGVDIPTRIVQQDCNEKTRVLLT